MSNYNSKLQTNNTILQTIFNTLNELPEAGGGDESNGNNHPNITVILTGDRVDSTTTHTYYSSSNLNTAMILFGSSKAGINTVTIDDSNVKYQEGSVITTSSGIPCPFIYLWDINNSITITINLFDAS